MDINRNDTAVVFIDPQNEVWAVREDGKLLHNWVERSSWELFQRLSVVYISGKQMRNTRSSPCDETGSAIGYIGNRISNFSYDAELRIEPFWNMHNFVVVLFQRRNRPIRMESASPSWIA